MEKSNIKDVVLAVTYKCNSRCRMCNIWQIKDHSNDFKIEDVSGLPESVRDINISGGEPFLRGDLVELIKRIAEERPKARIIISTNGFATGLIIKQVEKILKFKPDLGVAISLDGVGEAHNQVRHIPNGFDMAIDTLKRLKKLGVKSLKIGFTLGDYNTEELPKMYELARDLKVELSLALVHSSENYFGKENKLDNKKEIIKKLDWLINKELSSLDPKRWGRAFFAFGMREFALTGKRILPDYSGELNIFIDPRGDVYPCDVSTKKIGVLREEGMKLDKNICDDSCPESWMMCTARVAIKKHIFRGMGWVAKRKFLKI